MIGADLQVGIKILVNELYGRGNKFYLLVTGIFEENLARARRTGQYHRMGAGQEGFFVNGQGKLLG